jgi:TIR domain
MDEKKSSNARDIVFISKATPGDDEFTMWLAPRLEAAGYRVFADILVLEPGDRWRNILTSTLQDRAIKLLLCSSDATLAREGVREELGIGLDLAKSLNDTKFVIPLRLEPYKKVFGMGELQYVDFHRGWAEGLSKLLDALKRQKVPCDLSRIHINPHWEIYRRRNAIALRDEPERLTSNWLRISEAPEEIGYFELSGVSAHNAIQRIVDNAKFPTCLHGAGFITFATLDEVNETAAGIGVLVKKQSLSLLEVLEGGSNLLGLAKQDASNMIVAMFRKAWDNFCRERGLLEYRYSNATGFHISAKQSELGQRISWGHQGDRRWSMLRNTAKGHVWQFGVTGLPWLWPFPHFRIKSRVLFAPPTVDEIGEPYDDAPKQHRLRRTVCKGWRNKQWHGRLQAFLELLSQESAFINLPLSPSKTLKLVAQPMTFTSPVSTQLPNTLSDDEEEVDDTTLGRPEPNEIE